MAAIAWNVISNTYEPLAIQLEAVDMQVEDGGFKLSVGAIKNLETTNIPDGWQYNTIRVFSYDRKKKIWVAKDKAGRVNVLSLDEILSHDDMKPVVGNANVVNGMNFLDRMYGNPIPFDMAVNNSKIYDPTTAPKITLPGTRAFAVRTPRTPPATSSSAASSSGGSALGKRVLESDLDTASSASSASKKVCPSLPHCTSLAHTLPACCVRSEASISPRRRARSSRASAQKMLAPAHS